MGPELARRWLAALVMAPWSEREGIVESVERRMAELYAPEGRSAKSRVEETPAAEPSGTREIRVVLPPRERGGVTEQIIRTYEVKDAKAAKREKAVKKGKGA